MAELHNLRADMVGKGATANLHSNNSSTGNPNSMASSHSSTVEDLNREDTDHHSRATRTRSSSSMVEVVLEVMELRHSRGADTALLHHHPGTNYQARL